MTKMTLKEMLESATEEFGKMDGASVRVGAPNEELDKLRKKVKELEQSNGKTIRELNQLNTRATQETPKHYGIPKKYFNLTALKNLTVIGLSLALFGTGVYYLSRFVYRGAISPVIEYVKTTNKLEEILSKSNLVNVDPNDDANHKGPLIKFKSDFIIFGHPNPDSIAISNNKIYVTNSGDNNIYIFDMEENWFSSFGGWGDEKGNFISPQGMSIYDSIIYVADTVNKRVQLFELSGEYISQFGKDGTGDGEFIKPLDIAIKNKKIYVVNGGEDISNLPYDPKIEVFDLNGNFLFKFGKKGTGDGEFKSPTSIEIYNDKIYIGDDGNNKIDIFDLDGNYLSEFRRKWKVNREFDPPSHIAIDNGWVYISDEKNNRIQIFDLEGNYVSQFYRGETYFTAPKDITIHNNLMYVVDSGNGKIQIFQIK